MSDHHTEVLMGLSRKRQRELNRLKRTTNELWDDQKEVLEQAASVLQEARRQLANVSREEIAPRVRETYESRIRPGVESGIAGGRRLADSARSRITRDVLPAVSSALGTALATLEVAKDPRIREVVKRVRSASSKAVVVPAKSSSGFGRYLVIGVGIVALAGVAYAAWQTLRADDELWVTDDDEDTATAR